MHHTKNQSSLHRQKRRSINGKRKKRRRKKSLMLWYRVIHATTAPVSLSRSLFLYMPLELPLQLLQPRLSTRRNQCEEANLRCRELCSLHEVRLKGLGEGETQIRRVASSADSHSHESAGADILVHLWDWKWGSSMQEVCSTGSDFLYLLSLPFHIYIWI